MRLKPQLLWTASSYCRSSLAKNPAARVVEVFRNADRDGAFIDGGEMRQQFMEAREEILFVQRGQAGDALLVLEKLNQKEALQRPA